MLCMAIVLIVFMYSSISSLTILYIKSKHPFPKCMFTEWMLR